MPAVKESALQHGAGALDIIDIRGDAVGLSLRDEVAALVDPADGGARRLPTLLLYDEQGLQLFERITYLDAYYLTNCEMALLDAAAAELAATVPAGAMVMELGSGNLRKVCRLLQAFEDQAKPIDYYALDVSLTELQRTLAHAPAFAHVACHGLLGTYDDGSAWLRRPAVAARPKCVLHLGSSIGNFARDGAAAFLAGFADLMRPAVDSVVVGIDMCGDPDKIYHAYNDDEGITHQFILNGLAHANALFDQPVFTLADWAVVGEYVYDDAGGRHQAFVVPVRDTLVALPGRPCVVRAHERVFIEQSLKYSRTGCERLWRQAGLRPAREWMTPAGEYGLHLLRRARLPFARAPALYAPAPLPALRDWHALWEAWDTLTTAMLPPRGLGDKPIRLRNACIFYLGHIPTFLDLQLARAAARPLTEPARFAAIFERGIDPDVDNPERCHDHSPVPAEWPPAADIAAYQRRVRARLVALYRRPGREGGGGCSSDRVDDADADVDADADADADADNPPALLPRPLARAVWVAFEHELMHLETLLYMMLHSDKTMPPPHAPRPDFERMAVAARRARVPNRWFRVPAQTITLGMDDPPDGTDPAVHFGWDNEKPARQVAVHAFEAQGRPITNQEYAQYMYGSNVDQMPASWSCTDAPTNGNGNGTAAGATNGHADALPDSFLHNKAVRTVYGLVPLRHALDWPVFASYDELARCASWMGGRIPSLHEARSIYAYVDGQRRKLATQSLLAKKVPAVNGHLVNDGVEETPPSGPSPPSSSAGPAAAAAAAAEASRPELFIDLTDANVGFKHWHPVPVTDRGDTLAGQADMGGVWEWTSTPLQPHAGFEPMAQYPAYTADFFDGKHNVVLGGSWATHPRIAGRRSFVNWYQRNYPYAWVGARLVRDAQQ